MVIFPFTYPRKDISKVELKGTLILKRPSASVFVPIDLSPATWIVAPVIGSLFESTTVPVTLFIFCA
jgi:predicted P-loop ATPase/GTPase